MKTNLHYSELEEVTINLDEFEIRSAILEYLKNIPLTGDYMKQKNQGITVEIYDDTDQYGDKREVKAEVHIVFKKPTGKKVIEDAEAEQ